LPPTTVADVMLRRPKTLPADVTVAEARAALERASVKMLLLVDGDRFRGAVTALPDDADPAGRAVAFSDDAPPTATADMSVSHALELLEDRSHGRVVVLDGEERLVGLVCLATDGVSFCGSESG
jgi:CBS domain-containing protein